MTLKTSVSVVGCLAIGATAAAVALGSDQPTSPEASAKGPPAPRYCPKGDESGYDATDLVGRTVRVAKIRAEEEDCSLRVVKRNGKWLAVSDDVDYKRINVATENARVKRVVGIH